MNGEGNGYLQGVLMNKSGREYDGYLVISNMNCRMGVIGGAVSQFLMRLALKQLNHSGDHRTPISYVEDPCFHFKPHLEA